MTRQDYFFVGALLVAVIVAPAISSASNKIPTAISEWNLRAAIDSNMVELRKIFPNLQGVGTSLRQGEVLLTIFKEHSAAETAYPAGSW